MPANVTVRTAHALAFRSVGYVYKSRLASSPWAWFPYLKEKMPRALDSVMRTGRDSTSAGAVIIRTLEQFGVTPFRWTVLGCGNQRLLNDFSRS